ncbi:MAG: GntR family transcriptional regulator, partial [Paracoccaceae bacterium]
NVYARLREMILTNMLQAGQKLVDRDLAEQLGVSRTPVREALGRMAMMGLVEARSRRGYYVSEYTTEQMSDLYEFRKMLEVEAARLAALNAQPSHLQEFDRILADSEKLVSTPGSFARTVKLDLELHQLIARASGNSSLHQAIRNLLDKVVCFIWVDWVDEATANTITIATAHAEHQALICSIKEKDSKAAAETMEAHIEGAKGGLEKLFQAREDLRKAVLA